MLIKKKLEIYGHSHPIETIPIPSRDDRKTLQIIGQKKSRLVSAITGKEVEFGSNEFDVNESEYIVERSGFGDVNM